MKGLPGSLVRVTVGICLALVMVFSLRTFDLSRSPQEKYDRLYFPSGRFLRESSLGFREANADYLWFRFIQYYGAFAKGYNNFKHFELLIDAITRLDPRFVEAYHFASLVTWSDLGRPYESIDILKRGILHNPESARLFFQVGLIYYVVDQDYPRASYWFERATACSDATDLERRFAAFARYRGDDFLGSLELWEHLQATSDQPGMKKLAQKMITVIREKIENSSKAGREAG